MPPRPDQLWGERRLWRLLLPTLVAPALAVAGAALAGMTDCTAEAQAHPIPNASETTGSPDSSRAVDSRVTEQSAPGPERFHSGPTQDFLITPASIDPDDNDTGPRKAGFGYGLRVDRSALPDTKAPTAVRIDSESPVGAAPPQPEFTPD